MDLLYIILAITIVSLLSLVGIISLRISNKNIKKITLFLVSLSAGTLIGGAFLHLIPEVMEEAGIDSNIMLYVIFGLIIFFVLEKVIFWRHCHIPTTENHPHPIGKMNIIGDGLHNFIDGMAIAGAFMVNPQVGIAATIGIIAHEIPQEIADFGVLLHAGYTKKKALMFNFLTALTAFAGAFLVYLLGNLFEDIMVYVLAITAGGFIYIATADLIPELKKETNWHKSVAQLIVILVGIGFMYVLTFFE